MEEELSQVKGPLISSKSPAGVPWRRNLGSAARRARRREAIAREALDREEPTTLPTGPVARLTGDFSPGSVTVPLPKYANAVAFDLEKYPGGLEALKKSGLKHFVNIYSEPQGTQAPKGYTEEGCIVVPKDSGTGHGVGRPVQYFQYFFQKILGRCDNTFWKLMDAYLNRVEPPSSSSSTPQLLEVCSGMGNAALQLKAMYPEADIAGINWFDMLKHRNIEVEEDFFLHTAKTFNVPVNVYDLPKIIFGDARTNMCNLTDERYDVILSQHCIRKFVRHCKKDKRPYKLSPLIRLLKPGGIALLQVGELHEREPFWFMTLQDQADMLRFDSWEPYEMPWLGPNLTEWYFQPSDFKDAEFRLYSSAVAAGITVAGFIIQHPSRHICASWSGSEVDGQAILLISRSCGDTGCMQDSPQVQLQEELAKLLASETPLLEKDKDRQKWRQVVEELGREIDLPCKE
ncbi:hypothetical protein CYMTET_43638 [Cymbomonas tetramitiformis]|uniref:Methyltransferase domain-containing protein n=2 Tax=Cymbomonas tetramitiformis TaxID=36881 RepID=A0AAE0C324_9CHLO|nr:hypothetical protein CYMTET_43638 [Cymbomonas tetramitiformis]